MGPLRGTTRAMIRASLSPWEAWVTEHPDTLAPAEPGMRGMSRERPYDRFVVGLAPKRPLAATPIPRGTRQQDRHSKFASGE
jgi:hypothetical protein